MINEKTTVHLRDLRLDLQIGLHAHERGHSQPVRLWIDVELRDDWRLRSDGRYCYAALHRNLKALESAPHVVLLEELARTVAECALDHPHAERVHVRIEKPNVLEDVAACAVTRVFRKE